MQLMGPVKLSCVQRQEVEGAKGEHSGVVLGCSAVQAGILLLATQADALVQLELR